MDILQRDGGGAQPCSHLPVCIGRMQHALPSSYGPSSSLASLEPASHHAAMSSTPPPLVNPVSPTQRFNPSTNNVTALLASGAVYLNVVSSEYPAGLIRGKCL